jgi:hypothetical protein
VELKLVRELTQRQNIQPKKAEIFNYYCQWKILKHSGKRNTKRSFTVSVKTLKGTDRDTLKDTIGMARLRGSTK